jgi:hypothetical protein
VATRSIDTCGWLVHNSSIISEWGLLAALVWTSEKIQPFKDKNWEILVQKNNKNVGSR